MAVLVWGAASPVHYMALVAMILEPTCGQLHLDDNSIQVSQDLPSCDLCKAICKLSRKLSCSATQQHADNVFEALHAKAKEAPIDVSFIEALAATLKGVLATIKQYQPVISEAFGPPRVLELVKDVCLALDDKVCSFDILHFASAGYMADMSDKREYIQCLSFGLQSQLSADHRLLVAATVWNLVLNL